jgi:1-phosphofructokinase family hexose kinase
MLRVLTVTLNPTLDQVYEVPDFRVGGLNRPAGKTTTAGGKGINVARAYRALGGNAVATGLIGGHVGRDIVDAAQAEGIPTAFVNVAAESRICVKVADPVTGSQTEINEAGPNVSADEYQALIARVRELLPDFDVVVLSGSIPPGVPADVYAALIRIAQDEFGVTALLDASGAALKAGVEARPRIFKPNRDEAHELGIAPSNWFDIPTEIRERFGIPVVLVTAGADGAVIETDSGRWHAQSPPITVRSAVGSGDSLTAGFLMGWAEGNAPEALRLGVASGAVNAQSYRSGDITAEAVRETAEKVVVTTI